MKLVILILLLQLLLCSAAFALMVGPNKYLTRESIVYNLAGPRPLNQIKITFVLNGRTKIEEITIELNGEIHSINSQRLGIEYYPRLDGLVFTYKRRDEKYDNLESAEFRIPYDRKKYVDCGEEGRISYIKQKKVIIHAFAPPDVIEEQSVVERCERKESEIYPLAPIYGEE